MTDADRADALARAIAKTLWDHGHLWVCQGGSVRNRDDCNDADCKRLRDALVAAGYDLIDLLNPEAVKHAS